MPGDYSRLSPTSRYDRRMPDYGREPSPMAARRIQREKRRVILYWAVGLVLLVAAVVGLLVMIYTRKPR